MRRLSLVLVVCLLCSGGITAQNTTQELMVSDIQNSGCLNRTRAGEKGSSLTVFLLHRVQV